MKGPPAHHSLEMRSRAGCMGSLFQIWHSSMLCNFLLLIEPFDNKPYHSKDVHDHQRSRQKYENKTFKQHFIYVVIFLR